jgi:hypothetical protein
MVPETMAEELMVKGADVAVDGAAATDRPKVAVADCAGELESIAVTPKE